MTLKETLFRPTEIVPQVLINTTPSKSSTKE
jgi:hypothetical protein